MNAAREIGRNQGSDILIHDDAFLLGIPGHALAKSHRDILQFAFTALVADRAIQKVIDQQKLHGRFLRREGTL